MDSCKCWVESTITIKVKHCPSLDGEVALALDQVAQFVNKETRLPLIGKVRLGTVEKSEVQVAE